jgi:hypothetical protein
MLRLDTRNGDAELGCIFENKDGPDVVVTDLLANPGRIVRPKRLKQRAKTAHVLRNDASRP